MQPNWNRIDNWLGSYEIYDRETDHYYGRFTILRSDDLEDSIEPIEPGAYYAWGEPGCLWDGGPYGPFTDIPALLRDVIDSLGILENPIRIQVG